jgi:hypothetical protein
MNMDNTKQIYIIKYMEYNTVNARDSQTGATAPVLRRSTSVQLHYGVNTIMVLQATVINQ